MSTEQQPERIHKVLARHGIGSRRQIEHWIKAERIQINGVTAKIGDCISDKDKIHLDQAPVILQQRTAFRSRLIMYNKPVGEICTRRDRQGRPTVFAALPALQGSRWVSIGRLDLNTSGLLLFTDDGQLANQLMHPSSEIEREYAVRVVGPVESEILQKMRQGVHLPSDSERKQKAIWSRFTDIVDSGGEGLNHWYHVTLMSGRNHEVKRIWATQGITVSRLIRVRFGPIILPRKLAQGRIQELDEQAITTLHTWLSKDSERTILIEPGDNKRRLGKKPRNQNNHRRRSH